MQKPHFPHHSDTISLRMGDFEYVKQGVSTFDWRDPYYFALSVSWSKFFLILGLFELALHLIFATLYWLSPGAVTNAAGFFDDFFFSVETLATVGYGVFAPQTVYAHIVSSIEMYVGFTQTAIITGIIFVRYSRPKGRLLIADKAVITRVAGVPTLMIRLGNAGLDSLLAAEAGVQVLLPNASPHSPILRELYDLPLVRSQMPIFPLTWLLRHTIDEASPLHNMTEEDLATANARLFFTCSAYDQSLGTRIYGSKMYIAGSIHYGKRYQDVVDIDEHGRPSADFSRLHVVEAEAE